jgi:hypothetical protein
VFHHTLAEVVAATSRVTAVSNNEKALGGGKCEGRGSREAGRTHIGGSAVFVALFVEPIGVGDNGVGPGSIKLVCFDVFLCNNCGEGGQDLECLLGDVKVGLEGPLEAAKGGVGERADDGLVVNVGSDSGGSCDGGMAQAEPADEGTVDI